MNEAKQDNQNKQKHPRTSPQVGEQDAYDVVIVGGGMVGATLAASLAQKFDQSLRVALVEREKVATAPSTFDLRSIVLSRSTVRFLHQQGWWPNIVPYATHIETVMVERARQFGRVHFTAQEAQVRALGYVIANHDLGEQLWQVVQQQDAVTVFDGCELVQASPRADGWQVRLAATGQKADESAGQVSEYCISGRLLVVADGAGSATLKALGIASAVSPYGQSALVLGLTGVQWDQRTALERFLPAGESVAVLPRAEGKVGVVMAAAPEQIAELAQLSDEVLLPKVAERLGWPVAHLGRCLQRGSYPLAATLAQEVVRANLLVVGNAAQALHPIAGQGFNLAVRDLANFLQVLSASQLQRKRQGGDDRDLIPLTYLSAYARAREGDRQRIRQFCHQLLSVFSWQSRPLAVCRQLGMALFDTLPNSKAWLAHSTLAPRVPPQAAWLAERHVANELALF